MREIIAGHSTRSFGKVRDAVEIPDLVATQKSSYDRFLQRDVAPTKRKHVGLEALFQETFPIESYDKKINTRTSVQLTYYDAHRSIDNKFTTAYHNRHFTHVHCLLS